MIEFSLLDLTTTIARSIAWLVIVGALLQNFTYLAQLAVAQRALAVEPPEPRSDVLWRRSAAVVPPITLMAPAYNEAATVENSVLSLLALDYPRFEVIVINDGSMDETLDVLKKRFDLVSMERDYERVAAHAPIRAIYRSRLNEKLLVIDKANGGKADALNAGLNLARTPIVCSMDADSILEPDSLLRAVQPFIEDPERVVAVGGTIRIANGCKIKDGRLQAVGVSRNPLALFQTVEYLRAFLLARLAWSRLGVLTIISGAFGLFRRSALIEIGGYAHGTVGEDMELVVRLHRHAKETGVDRRVVFLPEPVCWTEAPETLKVLGRQRARWHRGAIETFVRHGSIMTNPKYGRVGMIGMGQVLVFDLIGPVLDLVGCTLLPSMWALGILHVDYLIAFFSLSIFFGIAISVGALALEEAELRRVSHVGDLLRLAAAAVLENFGYRQLNSWWRFRGLWEWMRGVKSWGEMTRMGFSADAAEPVRTDIPLERPIKQAA
jgi:cellulose synthase/poly-beta-1,6-N-acetylglucosamine synthase-like glycosyltransferase